MSKTTEIFRQITVWNGPMHGETLCVPSHMPHDALIRLSMPEDRTRWACTAAVWYPVSRWAIYRYDARKGAGEFVKEDKDFEVFLGVCVHGTSLQGRCTECDIENPALEREW